MKRIKRLIIFLLLVVIILYLIAGDFIIRGLGLEQELEFLIIEREYILRFFRDVWNSEYIQLWRERLNGWFN